jgi:hypothetical protein
MGELLFGTVEQMELTAQIVAVIFITILGRHLLKGDNR